VEKGGGGGGTANGAVGEIGQMEWSYAKDPMGEMKKRDEARQQEKEEEVVVDG